MPATTPSGGGPVTSTSGKTFPTINPATGAMLAEVEVAGEAEVERAVAAAKAAQPKWAAMTGMERGRFLKAAAAILRARNAELARLQRRPRLRRTAGRLLTRHPEIAKVSFTGAVRPAAVKADAAAR